MRLAGTLLAAVALVAGCNGDDGTGSSNEPPTASAGSDQEVRVGESVTLDASGSSDRDGDPLTFSWSLEASPAGSGATLRIPSGATTELTPDVAGPYTVQVSVSDGTASDTDTVEVTATKGPPPDGNRPPAADAGPDRTVLVGESVTLNATGSSDPDGDDLTFSWVFITPATSPPSLNDDDTPTPSFTPDDAGSYTLELTVSDGQASGTDRVSVTADPAAPTTTVYASVDGDDGDPGTREAPVATLERALEVAEEEDLVQIHLFDGRYDAEPYDYTVARELFIEGESRDGVVLDAGDGDVLTVEAPAGASDVVRVFLQDLTIETTGRGVSLPDLDTEALLTRVTCVNASPCARTGDAVLVLPVPGGVLTVRDSLASGDGSGSAFIVIGRDHLIRSSTIRGYDTGVRTLAAGFALSGVTLEDNGTGVHAQLSPENDSPLIVRSGSRLLGNGVGMRIDGARVRLDDTTIEESDAHGMRFVSTGNDEPVGELTDVTARRNGASGVRVDAGQVDVHGGTFSENGRGDPDDFVDQAGIYVGGRAGLIVQASNNGAATFARNDQDNLAIRDAASAILQDVVAEDVSGPGAGVYASTDGHIEVEGGTFMEHANGFYVTGATDLTLKTVRASDNRGNGLSYRATGNLSVHDSEFRRNGDVNVKIGNQPNALDLGTPSQPGGNTLEMGAGTTWNLSDERPDRAVADGPKLDAADLRFEYPTGSVTLSGVRTGPGQSSGVHNWRITGENQRIDFH